MRSMVTDFEGKTGPDVNERLLAAMNTLSMDIKFLQSQVNHNTKVLEDVMRKITMLDVTHRRYAREHGGVFLGAPDEVRQHLAHLPEWHVLVRLCVAEHPPSRVAAGEVHTRESFGRTARHESHSAAPATHIQSQFCSLHYSLREYQTRY